MMPRPVWKPERPPAPSATPVHLVRLNGTYLGVHPVSPITRTPQTFLLAYTDARDARRCARGVNTYRHAHGHLPARDYVRRPARFAWEISADAWTPDVPTAADVVALQLGEVLALTKGTNIKVRVVSADGHADVRPPFDRAAVCARMQADFALACPRGADQ